MPPTIPYRIRETMRSDSLSLFRRFVSAMLSSIDKPRTLHGMKGIYHERRSILTLIWPNLISGITHLRQAGPSDVWFRRRGRSHRASWSSCGGAAGVAGRRPCLERTVSAAVSRIAVRLRKLTEDTTCHFPMKGSCRLV